MSVVVYTDPGWALDGSGGVNPDRAFIERETYGSRYTLRFGPVDAGRFVNGAALHSVVRGAAGMSISRCQITEELLDAAGDSLRVVCRAGVGFDNLAPELLQRRGIVGFNIPDYCVEEVATHTVAMILAFDRGLVPQHQTLSGGRFDVYAGGMPRRLSGLTAGIIGFGRIGRAVALRLRSITGRLVATDPYVAGDLMAAYGVQRVSLDDLLSMSDIVTLHAPLDATTANMIGADVLSKMKPGALLVNAARGKLIDAHALHDALTQGHLRGAAIDVFSPENPHDDEWGAKLVRLPNVLVTSHRAFLSADAEAGQRRRAAEGIRQVLEHGIAPVTGNLTPNVTPRRAT